MVTVRSLGKFRQLTNLCYSPFESFYHITVSICLVYVISVTVTCKIELNRSHWRAGPGSLESFRVLRIAWDDGGA